MHIIDDKKAIAELSGMSRNARLWMMDRIGNHLQAIRLSNQLDRHEAIEKATLLLIDDLKKIGLFEMHKGRQEGMKYEGRMTRDERRGPQGGR